MPSIKTIHVTPEEEKKIFESMHLFGNNFLVYLYFRHSNIFPVDPNWYKRFIVLLNVNSKFHIPRIEDVGVDLYNSHKIDGTGVHKLGIKSYIPIGWKVSIVPRSSTYLKHKMLLANSPGTIDPGYRGEWMASLVCQDGFKVIKPETKILQAIFSKYLIFNNEEAAIEPIEKILIVNCNRKCKIFHSWNELVPSDRGTGGFGSTGD